MTSLGVIVVPDGDIGRIKTPHNDPRQETASTHCNTESGQDLLRRCAYLTPEQVAQVLQLSVSTVYRKLRNHQLPGHKRFGKWHVPASELIAFMATPKSKNLASGSPRALIGRAAARRGRLAKIHVGDES